VEVLLQAKDPIGSDFGRLIDLPPTVERDWSLLLPPRIALLTDATAKTTLRLHP
jgi:hypothetical protein